MNGKGEYTRCSIPRMTIEGTESEINKNGIENNSENKLRLKVKGRAKNRNEIHEKIKLWVWGEDEPWCEHVGENSVMLDEPGLQEVEESGVARSGDLKEIVKLEVAELTVSSQVQENNNTSNINQSSKCKDMGKISKNSDCSNKGQKKLTKMQVAAIGLRNIAKMFNEKKTDDNCKSSSEVSTMEISKEPGKRTENVIVT